MKLPIDYPSASPFARRLAREEYVRRQNGRCFYCGKLFTEKPDIDLDTEAALILSEKGLGPFPKGFLNAPIHLDHDHETGLTRGAVHGYCNAVSWVREGK